jgi:hypothetical protein
LSCERSIRDNILDKIKIKEVDEFNGSFTASGSEETTGRRKEVHANQNVLIHSSRKGELSVDERIGLRVNFTPKPISKLANKMSIEIFSIS